MAGWEMVRLGEVLRPTNRVETVEATREYKLLGVRLEGRGPFLRETVLGTETSAAKLFRVQSGDFIYSRLFACRGAFGVVDESLNDCYVSGEFPVFEALPDRVDVRFLKYWFTLPTVIARVDEDCTGSTPLTRNRYKENFFLALEIPLPPLPEQRRIVARIEALAAEIVEAKRLRREAVEEAAALIGSQSETLFREAADIHEQVEFSSFRPHVTSGPRNWSRHYDDSGVRFYRAQDIGPNGFVLDEGKIFISPPPGEQGRSAMLCVGDLMLVITGATVGRVSVFRDGLEPGFVSQHVAICRLPSDQIDPDYALWGLRSPLGQEQLIGQRYGQGKPGLNLTNIKTLHLPLPPLPEQRRIVAELDALQAEVDALKRLQSETAAELDALLPAILDRAFKGEL